MIKCICYIFIISSFFLNNASAQHQKYNLEKYIKKLHKPESINEFSNIFHLSPVNQDTTNACWSFATTSFIESEMHRLGMKPVRLSVMYPFFHAYIEKAREYVRTRGASRFAPGDLFTGVIEIIKTYGIVPESAYPGKTHNRSTRNHEQLEADTANFFKRNCPPALE
ncbi:MAG: hypothetical protein P8X42_08390 [Calditrichaceae bacterium]